LNFSEAIAAGFRGYVDWRGRSTRPEYWYWQLLVVPVSALGGFFTPFSFIFTLVTVLPSLSVQIRRLHDIDRSGWWALLAFIPIIGWVVLIIWGCKKGTAGKNRFEGSKAPLTSTRASKQSTSSPEVRRESPNDGGREAYGEASSDMEDLTDDELYALAWQELEEQTFDKGLWARLFAENSGDENKIKAAYIKERVEALENQRAIDQALCDEQELKLMKQLTEHYEVSYAEINKSVENNRESRLMAAINSRSVNDVLKYLAGGADPRLPDVYDRTAREMLTDQIQAAKRPTGSKKDREDQQLLSIVTVAERLWEKGALSESGAYPNWWTGH